MKKNYLLPILALVMLFASQSGLAQDRLEDNQYGTLILNWLNSNKNDYNLTSNDLSDLQVSDAYYSKTSKINHVYVNQAYNGIKIHNAISSVAVRQNSVFHYGNALISDIASKVNATSPVITPEAAINSVVSQFNLGNTTNLDLISTEDNNKYLFTTGGVSRVDIPVQLVFQPALDGSLKLAWDLNIYTLSAENWYSVRVDALTGTIIDKNDWVVTCSFGGDHTDHNHTKHSARHNETFSLLKADNSLMVDGSQYNVFPIPLESPNHGPQQLVTEPADLTASPHGWHDTNGVAGAEFIITRGNNVWSQEDRNGDNGTGQSPSGTTDLIFDFPYNGDQVASTYQAASITNLFYMNNIMHDVWYRYGFDEVSGNFQQNNYGNGGQGSDFVFADAQDGSGLNNANFSTPPDGFNGRMQMFLWSAASPPAVTVNSGPLAGDYPLATANFGAAITAPITNDLALVIDDNSTASTDDSDACDPITNGATLSGKIAVIRRGTCEFGFKVLAAENEGAIAVIIVNNIPGQPTPLGPGAVGGSVTIPSVMVRQADGEAMITELNNGSTVNVTLNPEIQIDGSFDNVIIAHEYGHGISTRLFGGPSNSGCLSNAEQMGEGWSDWFGLMVTMTASDLPETGRGIGTFAIGEGTDGGGIRPFPYSTDTTINPVTYGDTNNAATFSQPHGIGSIWSAILWDLTWKYIEKYGFDSDIYNGTGGNNKVMQLVLDGLKLQACGTGFVGGRDSILAADNALTGGADQCLIWEVFAARGVGLTASEGSDSSRADQFENFTMPPDTDPSLANCTALSVDEFGIASQYSVFPNPANNMLSISVKKNFGEVKLSLIDINGRQVLSTTADLSGQVDLDISALQTGLYILNIKGETINVNNKIIKN